MPTLTIDDEKIEVPAGTLLIEAIRKRGNMVPHYCYHPKLTPAGNCRMCLVEVEKVPKLLASCITPVTEGMVVRTNNDKVLKARQDVLEFMLINHPLDCPVCDQAGECGLQNYYMKHSTVPSRFEEEKVHKPKKMPLGPLVMLDEERCIACTRCVRFCKEVAGTEELVMSERGDQVKLTTYPGKDLENPYALNTVDICPVGALTNRDFRFKKRVWFLQKTPSICPGCATGCNINIEHEAGIMYRLKPRENESVNQCWMCDEGRMTFKESQTRDRLLEPCVRRNGALAAATIDEALAAAREGLQGLEGRTIGVIGSAQFTNEENGALKNFAAANLSSGDFLFSRRTPPNPSHDEILINADKNPNTAGCQQLGFKELKPDKRFRAFLILDTVDPTTLEKMFFEKGHFIIQWVLRTTHILPQADVIFPTPGFAEQDGTFVNAKGMAQKITRAFAPHGQARLVAEWLKLLEAQ